MPWLVDGDNLLGCWPGRRRSDAERRALTFDLRRFARRSRRRVLVVFDGGPPGAGEAGGDVLWAGPGRTADDVILATLSSEPDPRGWSVVTSDRSLGDRCRWLGARVVRAHEFRHRLAAGKDGEKPDASEDLAHWRRVFEGAPDEDAGST